MLAESCTWAVAPCPKHFYQIKFSVQLGQELSKHLQLSSDCSTSLLLSQLWEHFPMAPGGCPCPWPALGEAGGSWRDNPSTAAWGRGAVCEGDGSWFTFLHCKSCFVSKAALTDALNDLLTLRASLHPGKNQKIISVSEASVLSVIWLSCNFEVMGLGV